MVRYVVFFFWYVPTRALTVVWRRQVAGDVASFIPRVITQQAVCYCAGGFFDRIWVLALDFEDMKSGGTTMRRTLVLRVNIKSTRHSGDQAKLGEDPGKLHGEE